MSRRKRTDLIVVHVTATPPHLDIGAAEVDRMHKAQGWSGIGYHFVIRRSGEVENGRPIDRVGAHVAGWNSVSLGVSLVGGVDRNGRPEHNATPKQMAALEQLLRDLARKYPNAKICGHRDLSPDRDGDGVIEPQEHIKACPCFDVIPWARSIGLPAASIRGVWDAKAPAAPDGPDARTAYLQRLLASAGFAFGPIDGIAGMRTRAALIQLQHWADLPQTGEFDERTVAYLRARFERDAA